MRGRCGSFCATIDSCQRKLGDVAGVAFSVPQARFAWQAWYGTAEACRRSRTDVAPRSFAWQAWHFRHLRLDLRGRRGTFCTTIDVSGSLATK